MHIFSIVVWLGGLMYQSAVAAPIMHFEDATSNAVMRKVNKRFTGFVWMSAWTLFVTGVLMMLLHPNFIWFRFDTRWSMLLGLKQLVFFAMVFYAFGYSRMVAYLETPASNGGYDMKADVYRVRVSVFRRINVGLGITGLLLAAAMRYFG